MTCANPTTKDRVQERRVAQLRRPVQEPGQLRQLRRDGRRAEVVGRLARSAGEPGQHLD